MAKRESNEEVVGGNDEVKYWRDDIATGEKIGHNSVFNDTIFEDQS